MTLAKVVVLAIDAASPVLLERWARDGTLPNLRSLMARGIVGSTRNLDGFCTGSTWPSWYTGVTPARHGLHYLVQLRPRSYDLYRPSDERLVKRDAFWSHLSRAGRRVAVLDIPVSAIDRSINGIQTVEWGGHDALYGLQSHPADIATSILSRFGAHPLTTPCDEIIRTPRGYRAFISHLVAGVQTKTKWTLDLLSQGRWDLFIQVFTEAHCVGHQCWHLHDPSHPAHDPSTAGETGDPLRAVYQAIDAAIGEVIERAAVGGRFILSLHGMSHSFGAQFMLRALLIALGVTHPLPPAPPESGFGVAASDHLRSVWRRLPRSVRASVGPLRNALRQRRDIPAKLSLDVDTARSRCFPHGNGLASGGIRLNLAGREPDGIVDEGSIAALFEDQLINDLLAIVDEGSHRPLARRVLRTRDHYSGEHLELLPDLLVDWDDTAAIGNTMLAGGAAATLRAASPKIGVLTGTNAYARTGEHRPEGFFVAVGPGTSSGRLSRPVSIMDFAPTFASLFDVALPETDGSTIPELVEGLR